MTVRRPATTDTAPMRRKVSHRPVDGVDQHLAVDLPQILNARTLFI
ncbi:hypothetical protein AAIH46_19635 [Rhizobium sp. 0TCS1.26]